MNFVTDAFNWAKERLLRAYSSLGNLFSRITHSFTQFLQRNWSRTSKFFTEIGESLLRKILLDKLERLALYFLELATEFITGLAGNITEFVSNLNWDDILGFC